MAQHSFVDGSVAVVASAVDNGVAAAVVVKLDEDRKGAQSNLRRQMRLAIRGLQNGVEERKDWTLTDSQHTGPLDPRGRSVGHGSESQMAAALIVHSCRIQCGRT